MKQTKGKNVKIVSKTAKSVLVETPVFILEDGSEMTELCRINFRWLKNKGVTLEEAVKSATEKTFIQFKKWKDK